MDRKCDCYYGIELSVPGFHRILPHHHAWLHSLSAVQQAKEHVFRYPFPPMKVVEFNFCPICGRDLRGNHNALYREREKS